jgi:hypothetical protein
MRGASVLVISVGLTEFWFVETMDLVEILKNVVSELVAGSLLVVVNRAAVLRFIVAAVLPTLRAVVMGTSVDVFDDPFVCNTALTKEVIVEMIAGGCVGVLVWSLAVVKSTTDVT